MQDTHTANIQRTLSYVESSFARVFHEPWITREGVQL